jgi:homogentisate 1,2-dioxygenase
MHVLPGDLYSAEAKTGYAIHMYTANTSMEDCCLASADGDMLLVPQQGEQAQRSAEEHSRVRCKAGRCSTAQRSTVQQGLPL